MFAHEEGGSKRSARELGSISVEWTFFFIDYYCFVKGWLSTILSPCVHHKFGADSSRSNSPMH